ncbi:MAG TPA: hypothetical protein VF898_03010 [Chloroflexota bacterium]
MRIRVSLLLLLAALLLGAGPTFAGTIHVGRAAPLHSTVVHAGKKKKPTCTVTRKTAKGKKKKVACTKKKSNKPVPTRTPKPTAIATPTATQTATPVATATNATPLQLQASYHLIAAMAQGYKAAFFVCGLPPGFTASVSSNPSVSGPSPESPIGSGADSTVTFVVAGDTWPGTYVMNVNAYLEAPDGTPISLPPGGVQLLPRAIAVTVKSGGRLSIAPSSVDPNIGLENCSAIPPGFGPPPTATPVTGPVSVYAWVSDPHPVSGERETFYGALLAGGQAVQGVPVHVQVYLPYGIQDCDSTTDATGTASCQLLLGNLLGGQTISIAVTFTYNGQKYATQTYFET